MFLINFFTEKQKFFLRMSLLKMRRSFTEIASQQAPTWLLIAVIFMSIFDDGRK